MSMNNPESQEAADYYAQEQYEQEQEHLADMDAMAQAEADNAMEEQCKLYDLRETIIKLEGVKIPFNIIKQHIQPLKEWLDSILPKREEPITQNQNKMEEGK